MFPFRHRPGFAPHPPRPFELLVRHFFERLFDNELVSRSGDANLGLAHILAVLAVPGLFIPLFLYPKYTDLSSRIPIYYHFPKGMDWSLSPAVLQELAAAADRLFFVSLAMAILGLVTVLKWETLSPDRRDFSGTGCSSPAAQDDLQGQAGVAAAFLGVFAVTLNSVPALTFSIFTLVGRNVGFSYVALSILGHAVAVFAASIFTFFLLVALEGVLLNTLSYRAFLRLSPYIQVFSIVALLSAFFLSPRLGTCSIPFGKPTIRLPIGCRPTGLWDSASWCGGILIRFCEPGDGGRWRPWAWWWAWRWPPMRSAIPGTSAGCWKPEITSRSSARGRRRSSPASLTGGLSAIRWSRRPSTSSPRR